MADLIRLEIVTPTGMAYSQDVTELEAPTVTGEVGILPGHIPMLFAVKAGLVTAHPPSAGGGQGDAVRFAIAHGVLEVVKDKATILTESFIRKEDVNLVTAQARIKEVDRDLEAWGGDPRDPKRLALIEEEQWLGIQIELAGQQLEVLVLNEDTRFTQVDQPIVEGDDPVPENDPTREQPPS